MDFKDVIFVIFQFLEENGFKGTLNLLETESGYTYTREQEGKAGQLMSILDEYHEQTREKVIKPSNSLFIAGDGSYANAPVCSIAGQLAGGENILAVRLTSSGVLAAGSSKGFLSVMELGVPIPKDGDRLGIPSDFKLHAAGLIALDVHPHQQTYILTSSMDRKVCLVEICPGDVQIIKTFQDHKKFVVRVKWSPSGQYFATASYDHSVCLYRKQCASAGIDYQLCKQFIFGGQVEAITFRKKCDVLLASVRNDNYLHVLDMTGVEPIEVQKINMNALGDDHVSFTAMDISCCANDQFLLVSTDKNRLIIYSLDNGKQVCNLYGCVNDEFSHPRHSWHPSAQYIYSTSQDFSIVVWEVSGQKVVTRLTGHTALVRDIFYSEELSMLVSCGFDSTVRLWHHQQQESGS